MAPIGRTSGRCRSPKADLHGHHARRTLPRGQREVRGQGRRRLPFGRPPARRLPLLPKRAGWRSRATKLPNLGAVNFLIRGLLGTGATSTLRLDSQAKALGEWLRSRSIKVPRSLVRS
ncbi:AtuA-related protein [Streptomyces canus]|uniref:AtuA-related protein n=1 Tax=Streptomyces canus TaxID=58343 RepID=UPI003CF17BD1